MGIRTEKMVLGHLFYEAMFDKWDTFNYVFHHISIWIMQFTFCVIPPSESDGHSRNSLDFSEHFLT